MSMFVIEGKNANRMPNYKFQRATKYKNYKYTSTNYTKIINERIGKIL